MPVLLVGSEKNRDVESACCTSIPVKKDFRFSSYNENLPYIMSCENNTAENPV
jgi:hypothetical protein